MKIIKTLSVSLLLAGAMISSTAAAKVNPVVVNYAETPAKTVCIKHPAAADANAYFSSATLISFEVYKVGSAEDVAKVIKAFKNDSNVELAEMGKLTGDYQAFTISLKTAKNKSWFVNTLKKAGLNTIKINNNPIVAVEQL